MFYVPSKRMTDLKWNSIDTKETYFSKFQRMSGSLQADATANYVAVKQYYLDLANIKYHKLTQELNFESRELKNGKVHVGLEFDAQVHQWINQIKNAKLDNFKKINGSTKISLNQAQGLILKWESVISLMKAQQWDNLETELNSLEGYLQQLNQIVANAEGGWIDFADVVKPGETNAYSVASRLEGLLSRIQGEVLEQEVAKFIAKKMPDRVYVTGSVTSLSGTKVKPDLVATIMDQIVLQNEDGEDTYTFKNGQIIDAAGNPGDRTISLTDAELSALLDQTAGFSAKTTSGQITFHQGYNIKNLLDNVLALGHDPAIYQLYHFYQLGLSDLSYKEVDPYQRYALSKIAIDIIGTNNAYMITKNEIIPTYQYAEKLLKRGLSFSVKGIPAKSGSGFNEEFGNTNILGPKA